MLRSFRYYLFAVFLLAGCPLLADAAAPLPITGNVHVKIVAEGLQAPGALAFHPATGEVYVVEKTAGRVSRIRDGRVETVIHKNFQVKEDLPPWAVTSKFPLPYWLNPVLRNPSGLAFSADGKLYVSEDIAGGRLLEFTPEADGSYPRARPIAIPWMEASYSWESIAIARDGRMFLAGSTTEMGPGMYYGSILMRDPGGDWWMVDYGPFAKFSAVAFSPGEEALLTAEQVSGQVNWWDIARHNEIGSTMEQLPNLRALGSLPDGSILALQETGLLMTDQLKGHDPRAFPGRIVRIDPFAETVSPVMEGLRSPRGMIVAPDGNRILVSENAAGSIVELHPGTPMHGKEPLLQKTMTTRYIEEGRAPKKWPDFLRTFLHAAGVKTADEVPDAQEVGSRSSPVGLDHAFTLEEFSDRVPLIAGRVRLEEKNPGSSEDPLKEIRFLFLYPNQLVRNEEGSTPSLCLFSATHASGRRVKTQVLGGMVEGFMRIGDRNAGKTMGGGRLLIPMATCNVQGFRRGSQLTLAFLGIGMLDDFYLTVADGRTTSGSLIRRRVGNGGMEQYNAHIVETDANGESRHNLVIAGMSRTGGDEFGWYKIGRSPTPKLLGLNNFDDTPFVTRRTQELIRLAQQNEIKWREENEKYVAEGTSTRMARKEAPAAAPNTFRPTSVRNGEYRAPSHPATELASPVHKPSLTPSPALEQRADRPAVEREARIPGADQQAGKQPENGTAQLGKESPVEELVISRALEVWHSLN